MKRIAVLSLILTTVLVVGCNRNDANNTAGSGSAAVGTTGTADPGVSAADRDYVRGAAITNMAEVELGKLAAERTTNPEVKKFATMMQNDHGAGLNKVKALAAQYNIDLPSQLDDKHIELRDKLSPKHGLEFDRAYMETMVEAHEGTIDKLESRVDKVRLAEWKAEMANRAAGKKVQESGEVLAIVPEKSDNPATMSINQWAAATYPTTYAHREAARLLASALKAATN